MPSDIRFSSAWGRVAIEDLTLDGAVTYGVVQPGPPVSEGVPMLRVNNFREHGLDTTDVMRIAPEVEEKYKRTRVRPGDVLITVVGSVGQVAVVPRMIDGWNLARAVALLRPRDRALSRWLALCLRSPDAQRSLGTTANTTVQTTINLKDLRKLQIPMPTALERIAIEETLGALDDRLDLLRQTNATLVSIVKTVFRSWFIDFDPVRTKAEGREPEGMGAATAALFPADFETSAPRTIPKGWRLGVFGDLAALSKGTVSPMSSPSNVFEHYSLPAFDTDQLPVFETGDCIKSNKTRVPVRSVLQSKLNPHIPRVWLPSRIGEMAVCSTEFLPWVAKAPASTEIVYCILTSSAFEAQVRTLVTGTSNSHQRVKPDQVAALSQILPPGALCDAFTDVVRPLLHKAGEARWQAKRLAEIRDAVLPRLISGKLRVPEVQEQLEDALA